ncbi:MAG: hypothetical protein ACLP5H_05210 [Desulfomonilaceae bacterium]
MAALCPDIYNCEERNPAFHGKAISGEMGVIPAYAVPRGADRLDPGSEKLSQNMRMP